MGLHPCNKEHTKEWRRFFYVFEDEHLADEFDETFFNDRLRIEAYFGRYYEQYRFPFRLKLRYCDCDFTAGGTADLHFTLHSWDADGLEFDREVGIRAAIQYYWWDPNFQIGEDFEESFYPPLRDTTYEFEGFIADLLSWLKLCLFEVGLGGSWGHRITGTQIVIPLEIVEPQDPSCVWFDRTGDLFDTLRFNENELTYGYPQATSDVSMKISLTPVPYYGDITLRAEGADPLTIEVLDSTGLGLGGKVGLIPCLIGKKAKWEGHKVWYTNALTKELEFDESESEDLQWNFTSEVAPCALPYEIKLEQDLTLQAYRKSELEFPILGEPDTIVAVVTNLHDSICAAYNQLILAYVLDIGGTQVLLGADTLLNSPNSGLDSLNAGTVDSFVVEWTFEPSNPEYIFTEEYAWTDEDRHPQYRVLLGGTTPTACPDWVVQSWGANDLSVVPFARPLPDFAIKTAKALDVTPYISFNDTAQDTMRFEVVVTNRGIDWPYHEPPFAHPYDLVYLDCRVDYQRKVSDQWVEVYFEYLGDSLFTPLPSLTDTTFNYDYIVPKSSDLIAADSVDRVQLTFAVNGGSDPALRTTWEHSFNNNTAVYQIQATYVVDCAYPSDFFYVDGMMLLPELPPLYVPDSCPCPVFLYVADDDFSYSPPGQPPVNTRVEIGYGPENSLPHSEDWNWTTCTYLRDFVDIQSNQYKTFGIDAVSMLPPPGDHSYCFRVSQDFLDEDPCYIYVDSDGVCEVHTTVNDTLYIDINGYSPLAAGELHNTSACCIGIRGNVDGDTEELVDIGDLTSLISYLYIPPNPEPVCMEEANIDGDIFGVVDIGDLTALISYLYIPPNPLPASCP
jgi:hypothetical protein